MSPTHRGHDHSIVDILFFVIIVQSGQLAACVFGMHCQNLTVLVVVKVIIVQVPKWNLLIPALGVSQPLAVDAVHANQGVHVAQAATE